MSEEQQPIWEPPVDEPVVTDDAAPAQVDIEQRTLTVLTTPHVSGSISNGNRHVLPDSRLSEGNKIGVVKADVEFLYGLSDGHIGSETVVMEFEPIFCIHCGKPYGYVSRPIAFVAWSCPLCFAEKGGIPGTYAVPEEEFNLRVAEEVRARFGRDLTALEIDEQEARGNLGPALTALARESPYEVHER